MRWDEFPRILLVNAMLADTAITTQLNSHVTINKLLLPLRSCKSAILH
jgi:hypothetical protein